MAFAQLTYRDSLRDTVTCLNARQAKLYHMGIRGAVRRSTLADANERRANAPDRGGGSTPRSPER